MKRWIAVSMLFMLLWMNIAGGVVCAAAASPQNKSGVFTYELDAERGGVILTKVDPSVTGELTVPESLDGFSVLSIADQAFFGCNELRKVILPETVSALGSRVFLLCERLEEVVLPSSLEFIAGNPFPGCPSLREISLSDNSYYEMQQNCLIHPESNTLLYVLNNARQAHYTVLPGIYAIAPWAFAYCDALLTISLPDTVETIGRGAFFACGSLHQINLPSSLREIGDWAFFSCASLPALAIPQGVSRLGEGVFQSCRQLHSVILPDALTAIDDSAFSDCTRLAALYAAPHNICAQDFGRRHSISVQQPQKAALQVIYRSHEDPSRILHQETQPFIPASTLTVTPDASLLEAGYFLLDASPIQISVDENYSPSLAAVNFYCTASPVYSASVQGFSGPVYVELTVDDEYRITSLKIGDDSFIEFPAMGGKVLEESFIRQFIGKSLPVTLADIDAVSAATFTTNAVLTAINQAFPVQIAELLPTVYTSGHFRYQLYDDDTAVIIGPAVDSLSGALNIPSAIDGKPVVEIGPSAFSHQEQITSLTIPDSVTIIRKDAFEYCGGLTSLTLPDADVHIEASAFKYCDSLPSVTIPDALLHLDSNPFCGCRDLTEINVSKNHPVFEIVNGALYDKTKKMLICHPAGLEQDTLEIQSGTKIIAESAVYDCSNLKKIVIPDGVTHIGAYAFWSCENVSALSVPHSVEQIDVTAFACLDALPSFTIPDSLHTISTRNPFWANTTMTEFIVSSDHPHFSIRNNALYETETDRLVCYPTGRTETRYEIPEGTKIIGEFAFYSCDSLVEIIVPQGVTTLETFLFRYSDALERIYLPDSVVNFGDAVFANCENVTVYCPSGSAAHAYLLEHGIPFVLTDDGVPSAPTAAPAAVDDSSMDNVFHGDSFASPQSTPASSAGNSFFSRLVPQETAVPTPTLKPAPTAAPTAVPSHTVPPALSSTYSKGDSGEAIYQIKQKLQEYGYFSADAVFSDSYNATMAERVEFFQKNNGLSVTGKMDRLTLQALYSKQVVVTWEYENAPATLDIGTSVSWGINDGQLLLQPLLIKNRDGKTILSYELSVYTVDRAGNYYPAKNKAYTCQIFQTIRDSNGEITGDIASISCPVDSLHRIYLGIKSVTYEDGMTIFYDVPAYQHTILGN